VGLADVAVGNLTITEERLRDVDFVGGDEGRRTIDEIVVTGPKSPELTSVDDLSGKRVHVRKSSSYYESLEKLNARFREAGKAEVELILVPDALEDEDLASYASDVGVDGESVLMSTPVTCTVAPGALRVWVPRDRPGIAAPKPPVNWARLRHLAAPARRRASRPRHRNNRRWRYDQEGQESQGRA